MAKTKKTPRAEQNPFEVPLYTPWDVARYLHVPLAVADGLSGRFPGWPEPDFLFRYARRYRYLLPVADDTLDLPPGVAEHPPRISFQGFASVFVRVGVLAALAQWLRAGIRRPDEWERLNRIIWRGLEDTSRSPVPFDSSPTWERAESLVALFADQLDEGQTTLLRKMLAVRLDRVDSEGGIPRRVYPPTRDPAEPSPRTVVLDPRVRFGRPTVSGSGVPTDSLFERYLAGDSTAVLARDYDLTAGEVEEAVRYEARPPILVSPFAGW